jgi:hypothetical protein
MIATYFSDIYSTTPHFVDIQIILDRISNGNENDEKLLHDVRRATDKKERQRLKKQLPGVCFSGKFTKRFDNQCIEHSGLICLDFDGFETIAEMNDFRNKINGDNFTFASFVSPSGLGMKVLVKIPAISDNHKKYFNALEQHFACPYFDTTSKNLSRFCFIAYDPDLYQNSDSDLWEGMIEDEDEKYKEHRTTEKHIIKLVDTNDVINNLLVWHKKKFPMIDGQRNNNAHILAKAFNTYGVDRVTAESVIWNEYGSISFDQKEISTLINSAYKHIGEHNSKFFEDIEIKNVVKKMIRDESPDVAIELLNNKNVESAELIVKSLTEEVNKFQYWEITERGAVKFLPVVFLNWLQMNGFHKYYPDKTNYENYLFIKIDNNLVENSSVSLIKTFILDDLKKREVADNVLSFFITQTKLFKPDHLSALDTIDIEFLQETKEHSFIYYSDCVLRVTKDNLERISYLDIDGYIWKRNVLNRDYTPSDVFEDFDFNVFINNVSNNGKRAESMKTVIGFLMHEHKRKSYCPAIILNDEVISENPEGGTGKGIFCNAISEMRRSVKIDGKSFAHDKSFAFQTVDIDTQIIVFDDIKKHFNFEALFSIITEGLTIEKKNKDAIAMTFEDSPKICMTTNYAIKGNGNSFERRKFEIEFFQHYTKTYTPEDEFGRLLFEDWDSTDWAKFDAFMIDCLQLFLNKGLIESQSVNLKVRQLSSSSCHEFVEWLGLTSDADDVEKIPAGIRVKLNDLFYGFTSEYPDYSERGKFKLSRIAFKRWVAYYLTFIGKGTIDRGPDGNYVFIIDESNTIENEQNDDVPF